MSVWAQSKICAAAEREWQRSLSKTDAESRRYKKGDQKALLPYRGRRAATEVFDVTKRHSGGLRNAVAVVVNGEHCKTLREGVVAAIILLGPSTKRAMMSVMTRADGKPLKEETLGSALSQMVLTGHLGSEISYVGRAIATYSLLAPQSQTAE